jgi:excisionase family DNA binding protein
MREIEERLERVENTVRMAALAQKAVLSFDETALYANISHSYLYKLTMTRQIPHCKPHGKKIYFNRLELEAWLQQKQGLHSG